MIQQTLKSTEIEFFSINKIVLDIIKLNPIYQRDGKHDRYLVAEVQRDSPNTFSDTITRAARKIRRRNEFYRH
ncbi:hypothetical protein CMI37_14605 [Candidatus Pacearchaeota archaeon]|nr:hypothetical protein [Candidatus Pacearchaeota archaeon]|tara:strand:+ start:6802 stop:7020 length:219 start_codon:yes stop_codon:yes gene_type:complete